MRRLAAQPIPQGLYQSAARHGKMIYTSGMTPRIDGTLQYRGKFKVARKTKKYRKAVRLAAKNALLAAQHRLKENESIMVLQLNLFLNTEQGFTKHAKVADYASALLREKLGVEGIGSRVTVGVATLPEDALVEVALTCVVV